MRRQNIVVTIITKVVKALIDFRTTKENYDKKSSNNEKSGLVNTLARSKVLWFRGEAMGVEEGKLVSMSFENVPTSAKIGSPTLIPYHNMII